MHHLPHIRDSGKFKLGEPLTDHLQKLKIRLSQRSTLKLSIQNSEAALDPDQEVDKNNGLMSAPNETNIQSAQK